MSLNEFDIIQQYFSDLTHHRHDTLLGIGDDCALLKPPADKLIAVSTDTLVGGIHFFIDESAENIGYKSLAVNLSDLAAMGAEPAWVSLALTLPESDPNWLAGFASGFARLAHFYNLELIGGDITRGPLSITVTIQGLVSPKSVLKRQGAVPGDLVCTSGKLGSAALALKQINEKLLVDNGLLEKLLRPEPRVSLGILLGGLATACIDISDGLLADLGHLCEASGCGAMIELVSVPAEHQVIEYIQDKDNWDVLLSGGDDYELCFTIAPEKVNQLAMISRQTGVELTVIGKIVEGNDIDCIDQSGHSFKNRNSGFMHFK